MTRIFVYLVGLIIFLILVTLAFTGCTTVRPLTKQEIVEQRQRDTLMMKPVVVNNPVKTVYEVKHDTLTIEKLTRVETNTAVLDTARLASYLDQYHGRYSTEIISLQNTILALQVLLKGRESAVKANVTLQNKLDTSKRSEQAAKAAVATSNKVIYEVPVFIYVVLLLVAITVGAYFYYMKAKLRKLENQTSKSN